MTCFPKKKQFKNFIITKIMLCGPETILKLVLLVYLQHK